MALIRLTISASKQKLGKKQCIGLTGRGILIFSKEAAEGLAHLPAPERWSARS